MVDKNLTEKSKRTKQWEIARKASGERAISFGDIQGHIWEPGSSNFSQSGVPNIVLYVDPYWIEFLVHSFDFVDPFWIDIQTNAGRFFSLFRYLLEDVALVPGLLNNIGLQSQQDLYLLLSRFIFFYNLDDKLETFLNHSPVFPNAFLVGGPADIFVIELTDQLQKLKVEPVLLHYFSHMKVLQGFELRMTTSTRLKACLYSFTSPGGPMYPTRAVRHAAWNVLDFLFPVSCIFFQISSLNPGIWSFSNKQFRRKISTSSDKLVLPFTLPVVLAIFLLELYSLLCECSILFSNRFDIFELGENLETEESMNIETAMGILSRRFVK
ncbi:hypothetical protein GIB67_029390 [Kingdonia uniflora]|uniref:Uncharacterized protein n=1 Tax=Kingdonia uniflora TaxID=39325 RepID=A0A7J7NYB1_9MAGN|nr:hypothetical protein GIB67_029390 [Kingdonia uniflora]